MQGSVYERFKDMSDILRVTTPLTGQDSANKIRPTGQETPTNSNIQNIVNPGKITRGDQRGLYEDSETNKFTPNLKSNFDTFLNKLNAAPGMQTEMVKLFLTRYGSIVNSGMSDGIAAEMAKFLQLMKVDDSKLLDLLKNMQGSAVKFTGGFFDILRDLIGSNNVSYDAKNIILDFLKKYDSITGNDHNLRNLMANLNNIADRMMKSSGDQLRNLTMMLDTTAGKGNVDGNLATLRESIIPFLANYISRTKDFGSVRDNISLFILNFTRYELGSKEAFSSALNNLLGLPDVAQRVNNKMIAELVDGIFAKANLNQATALQDQLVSVLTRGLDGEAGYQNVAAFQNILQSALLNESVYMPLLHMMLPVDYFGQQMFSEIWVDPDDRSGGVGEGAIKLLLKFDIKDKGFFEMIMLVDNGKVDMQLYYPEAYEPFKAEFKEGMFTIIERNDLKMRSYAADKCVKPVSISEVFPKIYEGRNMINVTV